MTVDPGWTHARYCHAAGAEIERFAAVVQGADPSLPVPSCPEWDLAELIRHAGTVHRWATAMVRERAQERFDRSQLQLELPDDESELAGWLAAGAGPLVDTFRAAPPDLAMWAWGADKHVRFWPRRMLHETTIHRTDAELAVGRPPAVETAVAIDGVDELLANLASAAYFRPNVKELRGEGETLQFVVADGGPAWVVRLDPEGFGWARVPEPGDSDAPAVRVQGGASDVLLFLYGRLPAGAGGLETTGDTAVLDRWLCNSAL